MSNIINCYVDMWKNFANFSGRTNVGGYWWAFLANFIVSFVIGLTGVEVLATVYSLAALIPTISIAVRRLRDAGCSSTWFPWLAGSSSSSCSASPAWTTTLWTPCKFIGTNAARKGGVFLVRAANLC